MARYLHLAFDVKSRLLEGNPLGDPTERTLHVLAPEGAERGPPLPVVWVLPGWSGSPSGMLADEPWSEGLGRRIQRLSDAGALPHAIFALPDLFTSLGGCQFLNSSAQGRYQDHLWDELRPLLASRLPCGRHGVAGKSSGGYGALLQALQRPGVVDAVVCHSGDMGFSYCYLPHFPALASALERYGSVAAFLDAFRTAQKKRDGFWMDTLQTFCMAACYSPDPACEAGVALPFVPHTAALRPEVFARWLALDPVVLADDPRHLSTLSRLRLLFLDCGVHDEHALHFGLRQLVQKLSAAGVAHEHEEFPDGHRSTSYRYDVSLPKLVRALSGP